MTAPVIGVALGSGGARGWCHLGALRSLDRVLDKSGIRISCVAGTSIGALVGAAYAGGRLDALEDWARGLTMKTMLPLMDMRVIGAGLVGGEGIAALLRQLDLPENIEDLPLPFAAVATDLKSGREVTLRHGNLIEAVRASAAIPGVIRPQRVDGRWLIDGALVNPVPTSTARALGAEAVVAVNPLGAVRQGFWTPPDRRSIRDLGALMPEALRKLWNSADDSDPVEPEPSYVGLVNAAIDIASDRIRRSRLAGDPPHVMLSARLPDVGMLDFHRAGPCIQEGARLVADQASTIAEDLGHPTGPAAEA